MFVFALLLDYCVFVALLNRLAIQQLHLDLGIPHFFSRTWDETPVESYLASVTVLAICKISHSHGHHQAFDTVLVSLSEHLHFCVRPF